MAYRQLNQVQFEDVSVDANVPQSNVARLMYYLNTVCSAIEYSENNIDRLRNYRNWSQLSNEDIRLLLVLCYTLSPDIFDDRVFFQSDALCGDSANKFYKIQQVKDHLVVAQSVVIGGRTRQVNQIMAYKRNWMKNNYINPMRNLTRRLNADDQRQASK